MHLNLYNNKIRAEGAKALAEALPHSHITSLDLQSNQIGAEGRAILEQVCRENNITLQI